MRAHRLFLPLRPVAGVVLAAAAAGWCGVAWAQPTLQNKTGGQTPGKAADSSSATPDKPADASAGKPAAAADAPVATISVDAKLINIPVIARDKKGALIQNLTKDNFVLQIDGHAQTIRYFNQDRDLPLTLGLLVDVSQSQRNALDDERTASDAFLADMLNAQKDKGFVVQFARQTDLLQDVTNSRPKLQAALKELDTQAGGSSSGSSKDSDPDSSDTGPGGVPRVGRVSSNSGTTLYDALFLSSDEVIRKQTGRKALIILSDGVDHGSKETLASSIEAAQRADTVVYAIYFKGNDRGNNNDRNNQQQSQVPRRGGYPGGGYPGGGYPGGGYPGGGYPGGRGGGYPGNRPTGVTSVDGKKILQKMADQTGGRLFEVSKKDTFAEIYKQIGEELRAQYRLGYSPDKASSEDGYHQIDLSLTKSSPKDVYLQTRDGYYMGSN